MIFPLRLFGGLYVHGLAPSAAKERRALAALALHRRSTVATQDLCMIVWNGSPPRTADGTLYSKISHLRDLCTNDTVTIGSQGGYVLHVEPEHCDLDVFERRAHAVLQARGEASLELAEAALDLWRGDPFGDLAAEEEWQAEVTRLTLLRDAVERRRLELLLSHRRFGEALLAADALRRRDPTDGEAALAAMRALGSTGRVRDALRVAEEHRHELAEVGLFVPVEIAALERELLDAEPVAPSWSDGPGSSGGLRPAGLGPTFGRATELLELADLVSGHRLVTVTGEGGLGKSRLVNQFAADSPVACCVNAAPVNDRAELVSAIAAGLNLRQTAGADPWPAVIDRLADADAVVILDGVEHLLDATHELVLELLASTDARVVVASRVPLAVSGEHQFRLRPLAVDGPASPAVFLLAERARAAGASVAIDEPGLIALVTRLDGHPLAIELVAPRLAVLPLDELLGRIGDDLSWAKHPGVVEASRSLTDIVARSYDRVSAQAQRLFRVLATFDDGCTIDVVRAVARRIEPGADATDGLFELADRSLIRAEIDGHGLLRYRMLAPLALVGRHLAAQHDETERFARAAVESVVEAVERIEAEGFGPHEPLHAARLDGERANLATVWRHARRFGWDDLAVRLVAALVRPTVLRVDTTVHDWALELSELPDLDRHDRVAEVLAIAANGRMLRREYGRAERLARRAEDLVDEGRRPTWLAPSDRFLLAAMRHMGSITDDVRRHADRLVAATNATGDPMGTCLAGFNLALFTGHLPNPFVESGAMLAAHRLARRCNSPTLKAMSLFALGRAHLAANPARAREQLAEARDLAVEARCVVLESHVVAALLEATTAAGLAVLAERLDALDAHPPIEHQLQEVANSLAVLIRAGLLEPAARLTGALSRTVWGRTPVVESAARELQRVMLPGDYTRISRSGRRLAPGEILGELRNMLAVTNPGPAA